VAELRTDFSEQMPDTYDRLLVPMLFAPYAADLGARVAQLAPARVLEVAAGSGALTRELAARLPSADLLATDLAQPMLDRAAATGPAGVRWQQADAEALPVPDATVDVWVCQFGIMFVPDRARAYREAHRVLAPGGHLVLATWAALADNGFAEALDTALRDRFPDDPPAFIRDVPHGYADPDLVRRELVDSGARGPGEVEATAAHVASVVRDRFGAGPIRAPMTALVVTAAR
jgi:SAM-dependent methyltransferase